MKVGQLIEYDKIFLFQNHAEYEAGKPVPDCFSVFEKPLY